VRKRHGYKSKLQAAAMSGAEPGSVASRMSPKQRREFNQWLAAYDRDLKVSLRQWRMTGAVVPSGRGSE
jgi:hypothetical protein